MVNPNSSAIAQTISSLIQETDTKFKLKKETDNSRLTVELQKAIEMTDSVIKTIDEELDEQSRSSFHKEFDVAISDIKTTFTALATQNEPVLDQINSLKQSNEALGLKINNKLAEFLQESNLSTLKTKVNVDDWIKTINSKLDEAISISEENKKIDSRFEDIKGKFTELSFILESDGKVETLIQDLKTNWETFLTPQEVTELLSELNQRINNLISGTKVKIAGFTPELDREVQGELGKLIKLAGKSQILLEEGFDSNQESNSNRLVQVKAVVDYLEIAIDALTGKPNLVLAQKLRYASKERLRKIEGTPFWVNWTDDIFHAVKTPTKVLSGVVLALPISWFLINGISLPGFNIGDYRVFEIEFSPIKNILKALPILDVSSPVASNGNSTLFGKLKTIGGDNNNDASLNFVIALLMTGTLGGAVSVLSRIKEYDDPKTQKYEDDFLPFLIGLSKPILGGSFAFFIFLLLNSGVSPVEIPGKSEADSKYFYGLLAVAFIAGFSERFVPDLISQTEKKLVTPKSPEEVQGIPPTPTPTLNIEPSTKTLNYEQKQTFTLIPALLSDDYEVTSTLDPKGKFKNKTPSTFDYVAPTKDEAAAVKEVTITVATKETPARIATAIITLSDPVGS
jgi:hypothetical protein